MTPVRWLRSCLTLSLALVLFAAAEPAAQGGRPGSRPGPVAAPRAPAARPLRAVHPPRTTGTVVFIGGYFYDPFFGPYPWWPATAYPYWYVPRYDLRAQVRVKATPREAAVYVDGFYAGLVDDFDGIFERLPLTPGGHEITLYLQGFETARWRLYLQPGSDLTLRATLVHAPPGTASAAPRVAPPVPPPPEGTYELPRVPPQAPIGQTPAPPVAGFGTVVLHVRPPEASVRIDGDECVSTAPGYCEAHVGPGPHRVDVILPGYRSFTREITVQEGKTETLNVTLPQT